MQEDDATTEDIVTRTPHQPCNNMLQALLNEDGNIQAWPGDPMLIRAFCPVCQTEDSATLASAIQFDE